MMLLFAITLMITISNKACFLDMSEVLSSVRHWWAGFVCCCELILVEQRKDIVPKASCDPLVTSPFVSHHPRNTWQPTAPLTCWPGCCCPPCLQSVLHPIPPGSSCWLFRLEPSITSSNKSSCPSKPSWVPSYSYLSDPKCILCSILCHYGLLKQQIPLRD